MNRKIKRFQSRKLLDASKGQECTMNVVDVCNYDNATTIPAHFNTDGGKMGGKTHDFMVIDCCSDCHYWLDNYRGTEEDRLFYGARALGRTLERRFNEGVITIDK